MKTFFFTIALIFSLGGLTQAAPTAAFSIYSADNQNGKIKVQNTDSSKFRALISGSRSLFSGVYESGIMELVFYVKVDGSAVENILKTITINSSDYDGAYLKYYNEAPNGNLATNNVVFLSIPRNVNHGRVHLKYRYKDGQGSWQSYLGSSYYNTTNISLSETHILINSVPKVETILFGEDCGFQHAQGDSFFPSGRMEANVWKNMAILDSDIYWEWTVQDNSAYLPFQKQFLVYPYSTDKTTSLNGEIKTRIEAKYLNILTCKNINYLSNGL